MRLLVALLLVTGSLVGLAGCTQGGSSLTTASEAQGRADRAAAKWADDATLLAVEANELDDEARAEVQAQIDEARAQLAQIKKGDLPPEARQGLEDIEEAIDLAERVAEANDDDVGDGRAGVWVLTYRSAQQVAGYFVAVQGGTVVYKHEFGGSVFGGLQAVKDLGEWSLDSDDAAATAAVGNDALVAIRSGSNVVATSSLKQGKEHPVWTVGAILNGDNDDSGDEAFVAVDAVDGAILKDEVIGPVIEVVLREAGSFAGNFVAAIGTPTTQRFTVTDDRHLALAVDFSIQPAPLQPVQVSVKDPEGVETVFEVSLSPPGLQGYNGAVLSNVPAGEYVVTLTPALAPFAQWTLTYCTDGTTPDVPQATPTSCALVPSSPSAGPLAETLSRMPGWLSAWLTP